MKITELYIAEFGGLKDVCLTPCEGVTVVEGANESGKSTVMLFIKFMLYGLPRRGQAERARGISRAGHRAAGSMILQTAEETYRIERSLSEGERSGGKASVFRVRDGALMRWEGEPGEVLLGVPKEIFESSCHVGQEQCAAPGGKKESAAIRNLLSSADETVDVGQAEKKLEEIRVLYRHKTGKGGRIAELSRTVAEETARLERATANRLRTEELRASLERNESQRRENEAEQERLNARMEEMTRADLLRQFAEWHEHEAEAEQAAAQKRACTAEWGERPLPSDSVAARLSMLADTLERAEREAERTARAAEETETAEKEWRETDAERGAQLEQAGGAEAILAAYRRLRKQIGSRRALGIVAALLGAVCLAAAVLIPSSAFAAAGVLALVGGVVAWVTSGTLRRKAVALRAPYSEESDGAEPLETVLERCRNAYDLRRAALERQNERQRERDAAAAHRDLVRSELRRALDAVSPDLPAEPETARREAERMETFLRRCRTWEQKEKVARELAERERERLSPYREEELRAGLSEGAEPPLPEELEETGRKRRFLQEKAEQLKRRDDRLRTEFISRQASEEDPAAVADRLAALKRELASCEQYCGAVNDALEALREAAEAMRGDLTPAIGREAGRIVRSISAGRYDLLQTGDTFSVSLVDGTGSTTPEELLSGGTRDAAYLALRIALMRRIFPKETPPLMLDEALCQVDDGRLAGFLSLLEGLAGEGIQSLLFTCHGREAAEAERLNLPFSVVRFPQK